MQVVAAPVEAVTVFRNGALVERRGSGRGELEVDGLPLLFSSDTLRVRPERGAVQSIEETVRVTATPAPLPVDEEARAKVALQLARVDDEGARIQALQQALSSLVPIAPDPRVPGKVDGKLYTELLKLAAEE